MAKIANLKCLYCAKNYRTEDEAKAKIPIVMSSITEGQCQASCKFAHNEEAGRCFTIHFERLNNLFSKEKIV